MLWVMGLSTNILNYLHHFKQALVVDGTLTGIFILVSVFMSV